MVMNTGDEIKVNGGEGAETLFRVIGTEGQIEFYGWQSSSHLLNAAFPEGQTITLDQSPATPHQLHLDNMAEMIATNAVDYSVPESSLLALELYEGAYLSHRCCCRVDFPVDGF